MSDEPEDRQVDTEIDEILTTITRSEARLDDLKKRADHLKIIAIDSPAGLPRAELAKTRTDGRTKDQDSSL